MHAPLDLRSLPEEQRIAFHGALFAMSAADGSMDADELELIFDSLDVTGVSAEGQTRIRGFLVAPPDLQYALKTLGTAPEPVRCAVMMHLVDIALADDTLAIGEVSAIDSARDTLGLREEQVHAMQGFIKEVKRLRREGATGEQAAAALQAATRDLEAVGVPSTSTLVSVGAIGLGAGSIGALGMGLGLVPGLGIALLAGTTTFLAARRLLDAPRRRAEEARRAHATDVVDQLQMALDQLVKDVAQLHRAEPRDEALLGALNRRVRALSALLERQRQSLP